MLTNAEALNILRQVDESLALDNDKDLLPLLMAFSHAAAAEAQVIGTIMAHLVGSGFEQGHANAYALAAVRAAAHCYYLNRDDLAAGGDEFGFNEAVLDRMTKTFEDYNQTCKSQAEETAAATADNIIQGVFGKGPDKAS